MSEVIVTSRDGIQFRVVLHARTDGQMNAAIAVEQKWAGARSAAELESFHGDFTRIKSLDDLIAPDPPRVSMYATHMPGAPKAGPKLTLIQGGLSTVLKS
jgi:hypothetical protein